MVQYRYLGYGVTNSDGVAKLDHDAQGNPVEHSYVGTGAGKVDVVASLDDVISESSIVSETYSLYDYIRYDYATQSNHNDIWTATNNTALLTRGSEYSTISEGTNNYAEYRTQIQNSDCVIEMDIRNDGTTGWATSIIQESTQLTGFGLISINTWTHLKLVIEGTTIKAYYNNETTPRITRTNIVRDTSKSLYFGFATPQTVTTVDFKDFKVYPI